MDHFHSNHGKTTLTLLHAMGRSLLFILIGLAACGFLSPHAALQGVATGGSAATASPAPEGHGDAEEEGAAEQERIRFLAQYARIKAEIDGQPEVAFPTELASRVSDRAVSKVMHEEREAFEARTRAFRGQMGELERALRLARIDLKFAQEKHDALQSHIDSLRSYLGIHDQLAAKGQAVTSERLNIAQRILDYGLLRTDAAMLIAKAQQDIADVGNGMAGLTGQHRAALLAEFDDLRPVPAGREDRGAANAGEPEVIATANQGMPSHEH